MKNFRKLFSVVVAALSLGIAGGVHANPAGTPDVLLSGGTNYFNANPVGVFEQFGVTGVLIAQKVEQFWGSPYTPPPVFNGPWEFNGPLTSSVIFGDTNNPLHGLDFVYQFTNNAGGFGTGVFQIAIDGFAGVLTDVGFIRPVGIGGLRPTSVDRSTNGDVISWNFLSSPQCPNSIGCFATDGVVTPGTSTALLIVYTDAQSWQDSVAHIYDPGNASGGTFSPVPEPETYAMLVAGLGLLGFVARRRQQ